MSSIITLSVRGHQDTRLYGAPAFISVFSFRSQSSIPFRSLTGKLYRNGHKLLLSKRFSCLIALIDAGLRIFECTHTDTLLSSHLRPSLSPPKANASNAFFHLTAFLMPVHYKGHNCLLGVESVLRLFEYHRVRSVDDFVRDLHASVCWQAVHVDHFFCT